MNQVAPGGNSLRTQAIIRRILIALDRYCVWRTNYNVCHREEPPCGVTWRSQLKSAGITFVLVPFSAQAPDLNGDCHVGLSDLLAMTVFFFTTQIIYLPEKQAAPDGRGLDFTYFPYLLSAS